MSFDNLHFRARRSELAGLHGSDSGTVFVELAIVISLFILLFAGMIDLSFICKEEATLSETVRSSLRAVVVAQPLNVLTPTAFQKCDYAKTTYRRGIYLARHMISRNGLNPDNYDYRVANSQRNVASLSQRTVTFSIKSKSTAARFFMLFEQTFGASVQVSSATSGLMASDEFTSFYVEDGGVAVGCPS